MVSLLSRVAAPRRRSRSGGCRQVCTEETAATLAGGELASGDDASDEEEGTFYVLDFMTQIAHEPV